MPVTYTIAGSSIRLTITDSEGLVLLAGTTHSAEPEGTTHVKFTIGHKSMSIAVGEIATIGTLGSPPDAAAAMEEYSNMIQL